jgi:hypothetical protein
MAITLGHHFEPHHGFTGSAGMAKFKKGGEKMAHNSEDAREHYSKHSHIDHDGEHGHLEGNKVHYDEHGFQMHKHGGMQKSKHGNRHLEHHKHGGAC